MCKYNVSPVVKCSSFMWGHMQVLRVAPFLSHNLGVTPSLTPYQLGKPRTGPHGGTACI